MPPPFRDADARRAYHRAYQRRYAKGKKRKRKPRPSRKLVGLERFDRWPYCLFGVFTDNPCRKKPRWRNGAWKVCDEHRGKGCQPILDG